MNDYPKVETGSRIIAALIDSVASYVVGIVPVLGAILGVVYMLLRDGFFEGQSLGKKIMKLQVVTEDGTKADFAVSARRNAIFAIPLAIMIIPVLGLIIAPVLSLVITIIELMKVLNEPKGRRIGDTWAGTQVIKFSEVAMAETTAAE